MNQKRQRIDKRWLRILGVVCLSFLVSTMGGALLANLLQDSARQELMDFLDAALAGQEESGFWSIFWKYLKYDILIWLGGWLSLGVFLSGAVFFLRSISVGFTSAMLMLTYGAEGLSIAALKCLPQNIFLIPTYIFIMAASIYYLSAWKEEGGKRGLKRERRRKQLEYCILLAGSMVFLVIAAGVESRLL